MIIKLTKEIKQIMKNNLEQFYWSWKS